MVLRDIDRSGDRIEAALTHGLEIPENTVLEHETAALKARWAVALARRG
jgi:hypothetical protein